MDRKQQLIEKLGVYLEHKEQTAPLAARIIATLILEGRKGATFDNLVCLLQASKSSISTHLNNLQAADRIVYYTKPGDRKKYFMLNPNGAINSIERMINQWNQEVELHKEIRDYKKSINETLDKDSEDRFDLDFHHDYLDFLNQATQIMNALKLKLIKNQHQE